ncbi:PorP/SprF family type IX secretion system membrane protein [Flectobacillus major]|jgi:type IX secretion system PorP/SprF family membrane protein|uniref:PorP/SprF family type IX secretion system membrane protein n=1 Tax=Flectobacillus major TaxID=103 RepID=UPI000424E786|nr:type IX secretion system membrane protein PorP/SprF [Flectobacillus major]
MRRQSLLSIAKYIKVLTFAVCLASIYTAQAQQEVQYSQYMFNMLAVNPAYAGSRDVLSMTGLYRQQWVGIEGAPTTQSFTIDLPVKREKVGIGLQAYHDQVGVFNNTGVYLSYAYRVKVSQRSTLAMGVQAGATNLVGSLMGVQRTLANNDIDPAFAGNTSKWLPNAGTGLYLSNDRGYIGISVPNLIQNQLRDYTGNEDTLKKARQERHYFLMMGFVVPLGSSLALKPSLLVKATRDAAAFDFNLNLWIRDRVAVGASWRTNNQKFTSPFANQNGDAAIGMLEIQASDQFRIGYAYDFMLNGLQSAQKGSHEIMLRYEFGFRKAKILTPRYF